MKNYYEILEVNPKASKEIIEKAYKVLVKKYHPDLYSGEKKQYAEKKTIEINEAYHVLSDEFLKEQYDIELKKQETIEKNNSYRTQKIELERKNSNKEKTSNKQKISQQKIRNEKVGSLESLIELTKEIIHDLATSKEKRKKVKETTQKDVIAIILTVIVVFLIGVVLWFIPFTNGWMRQLLFENPLFSWIGALFSK